MHGYHGRYLRIDLTTGIGTWLPLAESVARHYLGGVGLGTWLLAQEPTVPVDDPAAAIVLAFSPLVGTPLTTSAKFAVVTRSPLTERLNDGLASSQFALAGKRTGADAFVLVGRCARPSLLLIDDGHVELRPADGLWGVPLDELETQLTARLGSDWAFGAIGPAGAHGVRYATVSFGGRHAGRGGSGAVLGGKNLLAIAVRGQQRTTLADPATVTAAARDLAQRSHGPATAKYRTLGTVANLAVFDRLNLLPTHNFQAGSFAGTARLNLPLQADAPRERASCAACTIGCEQRFLAPNGAPVRLEYESLFALGPLCGVSDPAAVLRAAQLCDQLGLDTISTGATIAFACECAERGLWDEPLHFGDGDLVARLIGQIATRTGVGQALAEGTRRLAARIGGAASTFAPHVKGLELPGYDPRAVQSLALGFAVGSRGADHNRSGAYEADFSPGVDRRHGTPASALAALATEDKAAVLDSLILCKFLRGVFTDLFAESAALLRAVTGWDVTATELRTTAERIVTAKKCYNLRAGWTPAEDTLPQRFLSAGLPAGAAPGAELPAERLRALIAAYYAARGWDALGQPNAERCAELALTVP
jgi:aldehyde:ferredoxin oxidoreductase